MMEFIIFMVVFLSFGFVITYIIDLLFSIYDYFFTKKLTLEEETQKLIEILQKEENRGLYITYNACIKFPDIRGKLLSNFDGLTPNSDLIIREMIEEGLKI